MLDLKPKLIIVPFLIGGFIGSISAFIVVSNKITTLRYEIKQLQTQLQQCKNTNQQLINQIQIKQEDYEKAQQELNKAYLKPPKRVYVKQVIKEPVEISNDDFQKMADLIKQAEEQFK